MAQRWKTLALLAAISTVLIGAAALWAGPRRLAADAAMAATQAQFRTICDTVQTSCESCRARARSHQENDGAMSQDGAPRPLNGPPPLPARILDGWGHPLQISIGGDGVTVQSPGKDGELNSPDDVIHRCSSSAQS